MAYAPITCMDGWMGPAVRPPPARQTYTCQAKKKTVGLLHWTDACRGRHVLEIVGKYPRIQVS